MRVDRERAQAWREAMEANPPKQASAADVIELVGDVLDEAIPNSRERFAKELQGRWDLLYEEFPGLTEEEKLQELVSLAEAATVRLEQIDSLKLDEAEGNLAEAIESGFSVFLPEPDAGGTYRWKDGSAVWRSANVRGKWRAKWSDGTPLRGCDELSESERDWYFDSPYGAAMALAAGGEGPAAG